VEKLREKDMKSIYPSQGITVLVQKNTKYEEKEEGKLTLKYYEETDEATITWLYQTPYFKLGISKDVARAGNHSETNDFTEIEGKLNQTVTDKYGSELFEFISSIPLSDQPERFSPKQTKRPKRE